MDRLSGHDEYRPCTGKSASTENRPLEMRCRSEFSKAATCGESVRGRRAFRVPSKEAASPCLGGGQRLGGSSNGCSLYAQREESVCKNDGRMQRKRLDERILTGLDAPPLKPEALRPPMRRPQ